MYDKARTATFSSSQVYRLMKNDTSGKKLGAPALKYIKQVKYEMKLGRSIQKDFSSTETSWGTFLERRSFKLLSTDYQYVAEQGRLIHPTIKHYSGVPDFLKRNDDNVIDTVTDNKCCSSLEKFCDKMEALEDYGLFKKEFPEDFWQLISNVILLRANGIDIKFIEAINYVPYESEIEEIRRSAEDDNTMRWLQWTSDDGLPWIPDGGKYKNLNVHRFQVAQRDVDELTERIKFCVGKLTGESVKPKQRILLCSGNIKSIQQGLSDLHNEEIL